MLGWERPALGEDNLDPVNTLLMKILNVKLIKMTNLLDERQPEPRCPGFLTAFSEAFEKTFRVAFQHGPGILHAEFLICEKDMDIASFNIVNDGIPEKVVDQDIDKR
jgi:hypothetical protein